MIERKKENVQKFQFKHVDDSELDKILDKNKNLFLLKEVESKPVPLIGTVNCNK